MFSTFTTRGGRALIIRAIDLRMLEDAADGCTILWEPTPGQLMDRAIQGTAQENMDRLRAEETEMLIAAERLRARQASGHPPMPVQRGRVRG